MSSRVNLSPRDQSLLRLLSWTPATTALLLRGSVTFNGGPFGDERRLRERLQALASGGFVRSWAAASGSGGLQNYYKLTTLGFQIVSGVEAPLPPRAFFVEVSPSLFAHTFRLAEAVVETVRACHFGRASIERFARENELTFRVGDDQVQPDFFLRVRASGRPFNLAFEIDNSTESLDSHAVNSVRRKLTVYHAYQDQVLSQWLAGGKTWERPRFRAVFLTQSIERAYHILSLAAGMTQRRRLVVAASLNSYLADPDPLYAPLFLDHRGDWRALVEIHPTAANRKTPVRLPRPLECPLGVC